MNGAQSPNGHHPPGEPSPRPVNAYADALTGLQPREIVEYELRSDPYANMLPGISTINAAKTISRGVEVGRRGNRLIMAISLITLAVFLLPLLLAIITQFPGVSTPASGRIQSCSPALVSGGCAEHHR